MCLPFALVLEARSSLDYMLAIVLSTRGLKDVVSSEGNAGHHHTLPLQQPQDYLRSKQHSCWWSHQEGNVFVAAWLGR